MLSATLLSSCSVKEDRSVCPCRLEIGIAAFLKYGPNPSAMIYFDDFPLVPHREGEFFIADVEKGDYNICVRTGNDEEVGRIHMIPPETEPDSLYSFRASVLCDGESKRVNALPHKQFCTVSIKVNGIEGSNITYKIKGSYNGLDILSVEPLYGHFEFPVFPSAEDGSLRFRLSRQGEDGNLSILSVKGDDAWNLPLGQWMKDAGYDWKAEDLEDFEADIDYSGARVTLRVCDWEIEEALVVTI